MTLAETPKYSSDDDLKIGFYHSTDVKLNGLVFDKQRLKPQTLSFTMASTSQDDVTGFWLMMAAGSFLN